VTSVKQKFSESTMGQTVSNLVRSWSPADIPDLTGKVVVITGANSGIGYYTALELGRKGATVIALCRDEGRGKAAVEEWRRAVPGGKFELLLCDLADLASVARVARQINQRNQPVDILVNNAGLMMPPTREETVDKFELQMGTNHLGHFALTGGLLQSLLKSDAPRVVNVASLAAWSGSLKEVDFEVPASKYSPIACYGNSKLANLCFTTELGRRYPKITSVAAHPGGSATNLQRYRFGHKLLRMMFQSAEDGALPTLRSATDPDLKTGAYNGPWLAGARGAPSNYSAVMPPQARNADICRRLWEASVAATSVQY
jgi:NAD(P)-dependent dehydrogenase (short-subunit alcohol dehydrogenase family)